MVNTFTSSCPACGGKLKYAGPVKRIVRMRNGEKEWIKIRRMICVECGVVHRELPESLLPYKHYDSSIIQGVISGEITPYDLEFEDYPCEMTMKRWKKSHDKQLL